MKVAMSLLSGVSYGGVTYFSNLIPNLAETDKVNEYHIYVHQNDSLQSKIRQDNFIFHECPSYVDSALIRFLWEQFFIPFELKRRKIDVLFTAKNGNIFLAPCRTIIAIRNMEPLAYENFENDRLLDFFSWMRKRLTILSIKKADGIIAVSQSVKKYMMQHFPESQSKIDIIYNGNPVSTVPLRHSKEDRDRFFLSASKFVAYANQLNLVEGYASLYERRRDLPPLLFAGGIHDKNYFDKIEKIVRSKGLTDKIKFLGLVDHEQLLELYTQAYAFIFPSLLEACPQTLIEAMACGAPVISSNEPPMPEICERAALYFDPRDSRDIAAKIDFFLSDKDLRESLMNASLKRCRFFDWVRVASELVSVFEKVHQADLQHRS
jgi:glycosyltransferase involved in cell wall biosynthesis